MTCTIVNQRKPEIKVIKDIVPDTDTGKFNLKIDSTVFNNGGPGYGDNGTTGFQQVSAGSHTVSEAGNGTTNLSDYSSRVNCDSGKGSTNPGTSHTFSIAYGEQVTCTIINTRLGRISGKKYYDANLNGQWDTGEPGIANWKITYTGAASGTLTTGAGGTFSASLIPGSYTLAEKVANSPWIQIGNTVDQTSASGGSTATLNNKRYSLGIVGGGEVTGLNFGNVCTGAGGGNTIGFWSNSNGQKLIGEDDLLEIRNLNLKNANGFHFDPDDQGPGQDVAE